MKHIKTHNLGQNLVEIVIILAVIVIAGVVVLTLLGGNINNLFGSSHTKYKEFKPFEWNNPSTTNSAKYLTIKAGELKGTINNPVSKCVNGKCSIDYGDYVLNGIPENFNEFVQTGGTSGGLDELANILMQIAEQYKEKGDTEGFRDFNKFANLAHIQADMIRVNENKISSTPNLSGNDYENYLDSTTVSESYNIPPDLARLLPQLDKNHCFSDFLGQQLLLGSAKNNLNNSNDKTSKEKYASYAMVDIFDTIQSKTTKYPESLRNLAQELYLNVDDLTLKCLCKVRAGAPSNSSGYSVKIYDPLTGNDTNNSISYPASSDLNEILHPQYSLKEDITGSLICTAGKNQAQARSCH